MATAFAPIRRCRCFIFYGKRDSDPDLGRLAPEILWLTPRYLTRYVIEATFQKRHTVLIISALSN